MHASAAVARSQRREFLLEGHPRSVGEARQRVTEAGERFVDEPRLDELTLVISEVVSNSVRHGGESGPIRLAVTPKDEYLCVQVTDSGPGLAPRPRATVPDEEGGWGFFLIEQMTRRWGVTRENHQTRVWFEFDFSAAD